MDMRLAIALVLIAAAEGVRRLPPDAMVLRQSPLGRWTFGRESSLGMGLHLVSWCIPASLPLIIRPMSSVPSTEIPLSWWLELLAIRTERVERHIAALRLLGMMTLGVLVIGVSAAAATWGAYGLSASLALLFTLSAIQATWAMYALTRCGTSPRRALRSAVSLMNPFSAQRAAEVVQGAAVAGVPEIVVAFGYLGEEAFVRGTRRLLYDAVRDDGADDSHHHIAVLLGRERLWSLLQAPASTAEQAAFCPRCAAVFRRSVLRCSDCDEVSLLPCAAREISNTGD